MRLVADIEADGLLDSLTRIHCICLADLDSEWKGTFIQLSSERWFGCNGFITDAISILEKAELVVGHNWAGYDIRAIKKLYPDADLKCDNVADTLLLDYIFTPFRQKHPSCPPSRVTPTGRVPIGPHSLQNIGYVVGLGKVENEDWSVLTQNMIDRCQGDVEITRRLFKQYEERFLANREALLLETRYSYTCARQETNGWAFDSQGAEQMASLIDAEVSRLEDDIICHAPIRTIQGTEVSVCKKDGGLSQAFVKYAPEMDPTHHVVGKFSKVSFEQINLDSDKQLKDFLLAQGWEPDEWNYVKDKETGRKVKSSPKITESSLSRMTSEIGRLCHRRGVLTHRRSLLRGLLQAVREDGKVPAGVVPCQTNTGRAAHRVVVNIPKDPDDELLKPGLRKFFTRSREGRIIAGTDLCSLENKITGHLVYPYDGGLYIQKYLQGDPHQQTADDIGKLLGLEITRHEAKTLNYATIYGAQAPKIAATLGISVGKAKRMLEAWWDANPGLKAVKEKLAGAASRRSTPYIIGLDGRPLYANADKEYALLNLWVQNAGAIVGKKMVIGIQAYVDAYDLDWQLLGNFHDETQEEIEDTGEARQLYLGIVTQVRDRINDRFKFVVPMEMETKFGNNWSETH